MAVGADAFASFEAALPDQVVLPPHTTSGVYHRPDGETMQPACGTFDADGQLTRRDYARGANIDACQHPNCYPGGER